MECLHQEAGYMVASVPKHVSIREPLDSAGGSIYVPTLRKLLSSLSRGLGAYRHAAQVDRVIGWLHQARASTGRFQPTLAVGRDGVHGPLRPGAWKEGSTATVSVLNRRGKRIGTVYLGQMPEAGQPTLTAQLTTLLQDILSHVDAQDLRLVSVSDDGYPPSD